MEALQGTARKLWDFAKLHGLRDDWHEPDEQNIKVIVRNAESGNFDNALGDDPDSHEIVLNIYDDDNSFLEQHDIYLNLATLCALATIGAGVVLGETKRPAPMPAEEAKYAKWVNSPIVSIDPDGVPRFSLNELNAILSTVLKSIGES